MTFRARGFCKFDLPGPEASGRLADTLARLASFASEDDAAAPAGAAELLGLLDERLSDDLPGEAAELARLLEMAMPDSDR